MGRVKYLLNIVFIHIDVRIISFPYMIISSLLLLLMSNAITLRRDKSILYSRATIIILLISALITYDNLYFLFLNKGIGIYGGLFHTTCTTNIFHIFRIYLILYLFKKSITKKTRLR